MKLDSKWEYCSPVLWMNVLGFFCYWLVRLLSSLSRKPTTLWFAKLRISMKIPNSGCSVRKLDLYFCQECYWLRSLSCRALCYVHTMPCGQKFYEIRESLQHLIFFPSLPYQLCGFMEDFTYFIFYLFKYFLV